MQNYNLSASPETQFFKIFAGLIGFLFFTSKEFLLLDFAFSEIGRQAFVIVVTIITIYYLLFAILVKKDRATLGDRKLIFIVSISLGLYLSLHSIIIGGDNWLVGVKYSVYLLLISLILLSSASLYKLMKIFVIVMSIFCAMILLQNLLLYGLHNGYVTDFYADPRFDLLGRDTMTYRLPYYFGYVREEALVAKFTDFEWRRSLSFTSEPKYFSLMLLVSLSVLYLHIKKTVFWYYMVFLHVVSIFLAMSFTGLFVVFAAFIMSYLHPRNSVKTKALILFGIILISIIFPPFWLLDYFGGYIGDRLYSMIYSFDTLNIIDDYSLFGVGVNSEFPNIKVNILMHMHRYGIIGVLLVLGLLYALTTLCTSRIKGNYNRKERVGYLVGLFVFFSYNIISLSEFLTPITILLIISISKPYKHNQSSVEVFI